MSRKFLTNLDLNTNELLNAVIQNLATDPGSGEAGQVYFNTADQVLKIYNGTASAWQAVGSVEYIGDTVANLLEAGDGIFLDYDDANDTLTITNTGVLSLTGTTDEITVSASAGNVTLSLPSTINADTTGNADTATDADSADTVKVVSASDTNGTYYVTFVNSHNSPAASESVYTDDAMYYNPASNTLTAGNFQVLGNADVDGSLTVDQNLTVSASAYFADDLSVQGDVSIQGNLNVLGNVNAISTTEIKLEDNSILLNSTLSASAAPSVDASLKVNRGSEADVAIRWNETLDKWELTNDGSNYYDIIATDTFTEDVEDVVGGLISGSNSLSVTYTDGSDSLVLDTTLQTASPSYLVKANGLAVDLPTLETQLITDSFARKAAANVGNGSNTSFAIIHNFNTQDVVVNVYDNSTYETVEVDVVRTNVNTVTVSFASAPSSNAYRVVIVG